MSNKKIAGLLERKEMDKSVISFVASGRGAGHWGREGIMEGVEDGVRDVRESKRGKF